MQAEKLQVKLFTRGADVPVRPVVETFHAWIKHDTLGELLIDVASYAHVHQGPSVLLVGHATDYTLDLGEGRPGLLFTRKRAAPPPAERLADALRRTLRAAERLSRDAPGLTFRTDELVLRVLDRLVLRNDADSHARFAPELQAFLERLYAGTAFEVSPHGTSRQPFTVRVSAPGAPDVRTLLDRVGGAPA